MYVISETSEVIILTPHSSQVWLCYFGSHMNISDSLLLYRYKTMRVKHNKLDLFEQQTVNMYIPHSKSLKKRKKNVLKVS